MRGKVALSLAAALVCATAMSPPAAAGSQSRSCQTMNQWLICLRSSGASSALALSCRSVDGHAVCLGTGGLRCEATGGRPVCRGGSGLELEILPLTPSRPPSWPPAIEPDPDDD